MGVKLWLFLTSIIGTTMVVPSPTTDPQTTVSQQLSGFGRPLASIVTENSRTTYTTNHITVVVEVFRLMFL